MNNRNLLPTKVDHPITAFTNTHSGRSIAIDCTAIEASLLMCVLFKHIRFIHDLSTISPFELTCARALSTRWALHVYDSQLEHKIVKQESSNNYMHRGLTQCAPGAFAMIVDEIQLLPQILVFDLHHNILCLCIACKFLYSPGAFCYMVERRHSRVIQHIDSTSFANFSPALHIHVLYLYNQWITTTY